MFIEKANPQTSSYKGGKHVQTELSCKASGESSSLEFFRAAADDGRRQRRVERSSSSSEVQPCLDSSKISARNTSSILLRLAGGRKILFHHVWRRFGNAQASLAFAQLAQTVRPYSWMLGSLVNSSTCLLFSLSTILLFFSFTCLLVNSFYSFSFLFFVVKLLFLNLIL